MWSDTVHTSLQNFISSVLDAVPLPALLQWKDHSFDEVEEKQQLQREVSHVVLLRVVLLRVFLRRVFL